MHVRRLSTAVLCAVTLISLPASPVSAASGSAYLGVPKVTQAQSQWCWAAVSKSILSYLFGISTSQCSFANKVKNRSDCCSYPSSSNCNQPDNLWNVRSTLLQDFSPSILSDYGSTLAWADVQEELGTRGRPFYVRIGWAGGSSGHMYLVRGYQWYDSGDKSIGVMDPGDGAYKWYSWPYFINNSTFTWTDTLWKVHR